MRELPGEQRRDFLRSRNAAVRANPTGGIGSRAAGQRHGRIINIASGAVTLGRPNYLHYLTSKAALAGMTKSMARELGPFGITVDALLPGATFTEIERRTLNPLQREHIVAIQCIPRPEAPKDLVGAVLFLTSEHSASMTGQQLNVDGGATRI